MGYIKNIPIFAPAKGYKDTIKIDSTKKKNSISRLLQFNIGSLNKKYNAGWSSAGSGVRQVILNCFA